MMNYNRLEPAGMLMAISADTATALAYADEEERENLVLAATAAVVPYMEDKSFFVDEQRVGPYKIWHHQHILEENEHGVLMKDIVTYVPPLGFLGALANTFMIKRQLKAIFDYRKVAVEKMFRAPNGKADYKSAKAFAEAQLAR